MTGNAYSTCPDSTELADRATWAVNSLLEAGQDELAAELAVRLDRELHGHLSRAS